ncbi:kinase-like protein, partial [Aspergillus steynii IBT 23096]
MSRVVDAVTSRLSLEAYARKRVPRGRDTATNRLGQNSLIRELTYLKTLSHTHLVRYVASYTDEKYIAFLMQPVADYDLEKLLRNLGRDATGAECLRPFYGCLAGAIQYLHENKIRHRDLKSRNILIKDGRAFVADFGTAYSWKGSKHSITNHRDVPYTAEYIAPEIALHKSRSTASDMWSLGVVFMEISTVL